MRWKSSLSITVCLLVYFHLCIHVASSQTQIVLTADAFDLVISDDLIIQNGVNNIEELTILSVESGLLNGSSCTLMVDTKRGDLIFYAEDSCTLFMTVVNNQTGTVTVSGASYNTTAYDTAREARNAGDLMILVGLTAENKGTATSAYDTLINLLTFNTLGLLGSNSAEALAINVLLAMPFYIAVVLVLVAIFLEVLPF